MIIPRRAIFFSLGLLVLLGLAYWSRPFFITWMIQPTARILRLIYRTLLSVDQEIYWALLILSALPLAARMFPEHAESSNRSAYQPSVRENDRVAYWESLLDAARKSEEDQQALVRSLETLQRSINAQYDENDETGICMPAFKIGLQNRIQAVWESLALSRISQRNRTRQSTELEKYVDSVLKSMGAQLENYHD